jgi:molybdenum cofactor cytidylyltransferase
LNELKGISAVILAAGLSTRMGCPKLLLPWKDQTILEKVITTLYKSGIQEIIVVIQARQQQLFEHIQQLSSNFSLRIVLNNSFEPEEMLSSIHFGLNALDPSINAALITLGDQPQIQEDIVSQICSAYIMTRAMLVIPSYRMRRGHPWLISQSLWPQFFQIKSPSTPHDFLEQYKEEILYVNVNNSSILQDIDTPEDYEKWKP